MVFLPNNFVLTILIVVNSLNYISLENQLSANKHSPTTEKLRLNCKFKMLLRVLTLIILPKTKLVFRMLGIIKYFLIVTLLLHIPQG